MLTADAESLLGQARRSPLDFTLTLVLADALDESGEAGLAEACRAMARCRLAPYENQSTRCWCVWARDRYPFITEKLDPAHPWLAAMFPDDWAGAAPRDGVDAERHWSFTRYAGLGPDYEGALRKLAEAFGNLPPGRRAELLDGRA